MTSFRLCPLTWTRLFLCSDGIASDGPGYLISKETFACDRRHALKEFLLFGLPGQEVITGNKIVCDEPNKSLGL